MNEFHYVYQCHVTSIATTQRICIDFGVKDKELTAPNQQFMYI